MLDVGTNNEKSSDLKRERWLFLIILIRFRRIYFILAKDKLEKKNMSKWLMNRLIKLYNECEKIEKIREFWSSSFWVLNIITLFIWKISLVGLRKRQECLYLRFDWTWISRRTDSYCCPSWANYCIPCYELKFSKNAHLFIDDSEVNWMVSVLSSIPLLMS